MVRKGCLALIAVASAGWLGACQTEGRPRAPDPAPAADASPSAAPIAWSSAPDCQAKLSLLEQALRAGRLAPGERAPIAVVLPGDPRDDWLASPRVTVADDLPLAVHERRDLAGLAAPCLLMIETPRDQRVEHRLAARDTVRSFYESGVRSERNPDYDLAQLRVRQAEREARDDGPDILGVGDPMLDLVGTLVGSVVAGFSEGRGERELEEAMLELTSTPRSLDRPVYRAYEFERLRVLAGKEATIPVALLDRASGRIWRAELRQRERRELAIIDGLDPRDRDYVAHRAASLTRNEFERWQSEPPRLQLSAIVAALQAAASAPSGLATTTGGATPPLAQIEPPQLDAALPLPADPVARWPGESPSRSPAEPSAQPPAEPPALTGRAQAASGPSALIRRARPAAEPWALAGRWQPATDPPALVGPARPPAAPAVLAGQAAELAAAAEGPALPAHTAAEPAGGDPRAASVVRLQADQRSGSGVYVSPDLVLTTAALIGRATVVDVVTADGARLLGLSARTDPLRNLALVQVARPGVPAVLHHGPAPAAGHALEALVGSGAAGTAAAGRYLGAGPSSGLAAGWDELARIDAPALAQQPEATPWFLGDRLIALGTGAAPDAAGAPFAAVGPGAIVDFLHGAGGALAVPR